MWWSASLNRAHYSNGKIVTEAPKCRTKKQTTACSSTKQREDLNEIRACQGEEIVRSRPPLDLLLAVPKAAVTWPNPICRRFVSNKYLFLYGAHANWNIQCYVCFLCLNGLLGTSAEFISIPFRLRFVGWNPINCYLEKVRWRRWPWINTNLCLAIKLYHDYKKHVFAL